MLKVIAVELGRKLQLQVKNLNLYDVRICLYLVINYIPFIYSSRQFFCVMKYEEGAPCT